jgi:DNA-binding transcriptional LysR family regulator
MPLRHTLEMDIKHLRYFVAAVEEKSLQAAANKLNVAQPALSRRVRDLEADLGCTLLDRSARGVALTRAGADFYREALHILEKVDVTVLQTRRAGVEQNRELRVGLAQGTSRKFRFVQQALSTFGAARPSTEIAFSISLSINLAKGLRTDEFDIALLYDLASSGGGVESRRVHRENYVLAVHPSHRLAQPGSISVSELAGERLVWLSRPDVAESETMLGREFRAHGLEPLIGHLTHDTGKQLDLVAAGSGICLTPVSTVLITPPGQLVFRAFTDFDASLELRLAWRTQPRSQASLELLQCLHDAVDKHQQRIAMGNARWAMLEDRPLVDLPAFG